MIEKLRFESLDALNDYLAKEDVRVINIETKTESYDTGLPLFNGTTFYTTKEVLQVWIEKIVPVSQTLSQVIDELWSR